MSEINTGIGSHLIPPAADVVLKERRRLVLMLRATPLHLGHLRSMTSLTEMGAVIFPPVPATVDNIVHRSVARALDLFDIEVPGLPRWGGEAAARVDPPDIPQPETATHACTNAAH